MNVPSQSSLLRLAPALEALELLLLASFSQRLPLVFGGTENKACPSPSQCRLPGRKASQRGIGRHAIPQLGGNRGGAGRGIAEG